MIRLAKRIRTIITEDYWAYEYGSEEERKADMVRMKNEGIPGLCNTGKNEDGKYMAYFTKATKEEEQIY